MSGNNVKTKRAARFLDVYHAAFLHLRIYLTAFSSTRCVIHLVGSWICLSYIDAAANNKSILGFPAQNFPEQLRSQFFCRTSKKATVSNSFCIHSLFLQNFMFCRSHAIIIPSAMVNNKCGTAVNNTDFFCAPPVRVGSYPCVLRPNPHPRCDTAKPSRALSRNCPLRWRCGCVGCRNKAAFSSR